MERKFLLVGLAAVALLCGIGGGILLERHAAAETGDWLSFAGSLIGAALTVFGAVFVIEWQLSRARDDAKDTFADLLNDVEMAGRDFFEAVGNRDNGRMHRALTVQTESIIAAREVAFSMRTTDADMARAWRSLDLSDADLDLVGGINPEDLDLGMVERVRRVSDDLCTLALLARRRVKR